MGDSLECYEFLRGTTVFRRGFYEGLKPVTLTKEKI